MKRLRSVLLALVLIVVTGGLLTAQPASAAVHVCSHTEEYFNYQYSVLLPAWTDGVHGGRTIYWPLRRASDNAFLRCWKR